MPAKLTVTRPSLFHEFGKESILQGIHERFGEQTSFAAARAALKAQDPGNGGARGFTSLIAAEIVSALGAEPGRATTLPPLLAKALLP